MFIFFLESYCFADVGKYSGCLIIGMTASKKSDFNGAAANVFEMLIVKRTFKKAFNLRLLANLFLLKCLHFSQQFGTGFYFPQ